MSTRILSIDGGGIRGIIPATILVRLEKQLQRFTGNKEARIADYFDLIAGTSTGSILTALYLCPNENQRPKYSAEEILNLYLTVLPTAFNRRLFYPFVGPKYKTRNINNMVNEYFKDLKLSELLKPCLITSYDMTARKAVFFNTLTSKNDPTKNYLVKDAVLASTAAPTYFAPSCLFVKNQCTNCLTDGGVFANNPALCALIEAIKLMDFNGLEDTYLLSLGNITSPKSYEYNKVKHWGVFQWAIPMFDILLDAEEQTTDYQMKKIYHSLKISSHYLRLVYKTSEKCPTMDEVESEDLMKLKDIGNEIVKNESKKIDSFARLLIRNTIK